MNKNYRHTVLFEALILVFLLLNSCFHDVSVLDAVKVFLYQLLAWGVTGQALCILLKIKCRNTMEMTAFSYALGMVGSIVVYLLFMLPGLGFLLPFVTLILGAGAIIYIRKKHAASAITSASRADAGVVLGFLAVFYVITLLAVSFVNTMPNETTNGSGYYLDWLYWAGNTISAVKGFPLECIRQAGVEFNYHYFSSLIIAVVSLSTKVDVNIISFYLSPVLSGTVFVLSAYYLASRVAKTKVNLIIMMMLLLFTEGLSVTQVWHTTLCPFGFDYSFAYGMFVIALLYDMLVDDRVMELLVPSSLFLGMSTGCKGPVGLVILPAFALAAVTLLCRRRIKEALLLGLSHLFAFAGVFYFFILSDNVTESSQNGIEFHGIGLTTVVINSKFISNIYESLLLIYRIPDAYPIVKLYAVWLYIFRSNYCAILLLITGVCVWVYLLCRKRFDTLLFCLIGSSFAGIILSVFTTQNGGSQMYFVMAAFPACVLAGFYAIEKYITKGNGNKVNYLYYVVMFVIMLTLGRSVNKYYETVIPKIREGIRTVSDRSVADDYPMYYLDGYDYEAFMWMRDNTDEDAVFAIDSYVDAYRRPNFMVASVFSQRVAWNTGKYTSDVDEDAARLPVVLSVWTDADEAVTQMREAGVDYLLVRVDEDKHDLTEDTDMLEVVFSNPSYIIYELV